MANKAKDNAPAAAEEKSWQDKDAKRAAVQRDDKVVPTKDEKGEQQRARDANEQVDPTPAGQLPPGDFVNEEKTGKTLQQQASEESEGKDAPQSGMAVSGHPGTTAGTRGNAPPAKDAPPVRAATEGEAAQGYRVVEEAPKGKEPEPGKFKAEIKKLPET